MLPAPSLLFSLLPRWGLCLSAQEEKGEPGLGITWAENLHLPPQVRPPQPPIPWDLSQGCIYPVDHPPPHLCLSPPLPPTETWPVLKAMPNPKAGTNEEREQWVDPEPSQVLWDPGMESPSTSFLGYL